MTVRVPTQLKIDIDKRLAVEQISIQQLLLDFLKRWAKEGAPANPSGTSFAPPKAATDFAAFAESLLAEAKFSEPEGDIDVADQAKPQLSQEDLAHIRKLLDQINRRLSYTDAKKEDPPETK